MLAGAPERGPLPRSPALPHPRRSGVNGGGGGAGLGLGLPQRLRGWLQLVDAMGSGKVVRTSPYGS